MKKSILLFTLFLIVASCTKNSITYVTSTTNNIDSYSNIVGYWHSATDSNTLLVNDSSFITTFGRTIYSYIASYDSVYQFLSDGSIYPIYYYKINSANDTLLLVPSASVFGYYNLTFYRVH